MKKKLTLTAVALTLALGTGLLASSTVSYAADAAKAEAPKESVRPEVGKALTEAQELAKNQKFAEAMEKIRSLDPLPNKTPYEQFSIDQYSASIGVQSKNDPLVIKSLTGMVNSGRLDQAQQLKMIHGIAGLYYNAKDYPNAITWFERYLSVKPDDREVQILMARAYYLHEDNVNTIKVLKDIIKKDVDSKIAPEESTLRLLASAYQKQKDDAGYLEVLQLYVVYYPSEDHWADLTYRVFSKPGVSDHLRLDIYRLEKQVGNLTEGPRVVEMAQLALQAGLPAEAKMVVDYGYEKGLLGKGSNADANKHLRDQANKQASDDAKNLGDGETQAKASKNGNGLVNIGFNYVINNQFDKGITLLEQGIAKGGLKYPEEAKLHLFLAYLRSGNRDKAEEYAKTLQAADGTADLARLWLVAVPATPAPAVKAP